VSSSRRVTDFVRPAIYAIVRVRRLDSQGVMVMKRVTSGLLVVVVVAGIGAIVSCARQTGPVEVAFPAIEATALLRHTTVLASDEFEGRAPGTKGEDLTVAYLAEQLRNEGLKPGAPDGTYFQKVPLVGTTPDPAVTLTLRKGPTTRRLAFKDDVVLWTKRIADRVSLDES